MSQAETVSRLRRLADDWRKEEKQLCEQFGNEIVPQSMRARMIRDTQAIDAAVEMIERMGGAMESLLIRCDDSDSAMYGTLSTSFVRDTVRIARGEQE